MNNMFDVLERLSIDGKLDEIKEALVKIMAEAPHNVQQSYECARFLSTLGYFELSIQLLENIKNYPLTDVELEDIYFKLSYMYMLQKDFNKAVETCNKGIINYPSSYGLRILQALGLFIHEKPLESLQILVDLVIRVASEKELNDHKNEIASLLNSLKECN